MEQKPRPRGRPRGFDLAAAVAAAQAVFWRHGLDATTLDQLVAATGQHKPSLYAAYGDKKGLYLAALDAYLAASGALVAKAMSAPRLRTALNRFFAADLDLFLADHGRGCFLLTTAVPVAGLEPAVEQRVAVALAALRAALEARLKQARAAGDLGGHGDIPTLADQLYATHIALAVRARAGEGRPGLAASARRAVAAVAVGAPRL